MIETGDCNADGKADIPVARSDHGALAEWPMNGATITQPVTPSGGGTALSPDASWTAQAKPTMG